MKDHDRRRDPRGRCEVARIRLVLPPGTGSLRAWGRVVGMSKVGLGADTLEGQPGGLGDFRDRGKPEEGLGLCLSGGGYRAMLFHVGALWRLYEAGLLKQCKADLKRLRRLDHAGLLALKWSGLPATRRWVGPTSSGSWSDPSAALPTTTLDVWGSFGGIFLPGSIADRVAKAYAEHLYGERHTAGSAGRAALRHQRHERPVRSAVALLKALYGATIAWAWSKTRRSGSRWRSRHRRLSRLFSRRWTSTLTRRPSARQRARPPEGALHRRSRADRWRRVRQPRPGNRLEALRYGPRQRCRRQDATGAGARDRLGTALGARPGHHRQPGAAGSQRCRCGCPSTRPCNSLLCRESISCRLRRCPLDRQDDQGQTASEGETAMVDLAIPEFRLPEPHQRRSPSPADPPLAGDRRRGACRRALGRSARSHEHGRRRLG